MENYFCICTSARSGSFFFMELLTSTGKLQNVDDYLSDIHKQATDYEVLNYWDNIPVNHSKKWGFKVDIRALPHVQRYFSLSEVLASDVKWIWLCRQDKIEQAISFHRADHTGIFHLHDSSDDDTKQLAQVDTEISSDILSKYILLFFFIDSAWDRFFRINKIQPHIVYYEDLAHQSNWQSVIGGVLDYIEVPYILPMNLASGQIKQRSDAMSINYEKCIDVIYESFKDYGYLHHFWGRY